MTLAEASRSISTSISRNGGRSGNDLAQERGRDVVDGDAAVGAAFGRAVVGVAVDDGRHRIAVQRLLQAAAAQEREDLDRLALDGRADRRVVEHGDPLSVRSRARADSSFSASSTASWTNCLTAGSPQAPSVPRPKPPAKPLAPAKPMPCSSHDSPSSTTTPASIEDLPDLVLLARLVVVVAQHGDVGILSCGRQLLDEHLRLLGQAVVGQVAAEDQHVGRSG